MSNFVDKHDPVLRATAKPVALNDIGSKMINDIIERMKIALQGEDDGVAIAAPQIGESLRIFVVSGRIWKLIDKDAGNTEDLVFINPEITKLSKKKVALEEGCLSLRWLYGKVERSDKATITAYDETGRKFTKGSSGLMAQIYQHEVDHLNGILFIDKATDVEDIPPSLGSSQLRRGEDQPEKDGK